MAALTKLNQRGSLVGISGENWVGVWSQACEQSGGLSTPELARQLSQRVEHYVIGLTEDEEGFCYWLLRNGKALDRHPLSGLKRVVGRQRAVLDLCRDALARNRVEAVLKPKRRLRPHEALGMTEEEFIAQAYQDMARAQTMSREELETMSAKYGRLRSSPAAGLEVLCDALGIVEWSWIHSDFRTETPGARPGIEVREV